MKVFLLFLATLCLGSLATSAQKKSYDIVSYTSPDNWKEEITDSYISYSKIDGGSWAQIAIYKSTVSKGSIEEDSQNEWNAVVLALHPVENEEKGQAQTAEGWSVVSRSGVWKYNGTNIGTILTTFSNGITCVSILCNATAQPYLKDYQKFISTVTLNAGKGISRSTNTISANNSIAGLWEHNVSERSGYISGGYFRKEYTFNTDGTYEYRAKNWSVFAKDILFVRETGNYTVNGNQLTIVPKKGAGQWWSKAASGKSEGSWGSYQKAADFKTEKTVYTFEIKQLSGMDKPTLTLISNKPTEREGRQNNNNNALQEFNYTRNTSGKSIIDNPPGQN
jgi:hypothetical protein